MTASMRPNWSLSELELALKLGESEHKLQQKYTRHKMDRQLQSSLERALAQMSAKTGDLGA